MLVHATSTCAPTAATTGYTPATAPASLPSTGIRVNSILPGLFLTPMFDTLTPEARKSLEASVPFPPRLGSPVEYAALAVHICENVMINGASLRLDGAVRLAPR